MNNQMNCKHDNCERCSGKYCAKKVYIFSILQENELSEVIKLISRRKYKKGQILFFEGDVSDKLFIINKGKVKIYKNTKEGKEQILYVLTEGDFIGDLSLLKKGLFDFNAEALEDVSVCILTKDDFDGIIRKNPDITFKMLEYVHDRLVSVENLVQTLSTKDVESRLASLLVNSIKEFGNETDNGTVLEMPLSREEMANYIGITRETISRKLTSLQDEGIVELVGNKKIIIKDIETLRNMI
jgi:CRP/FNR family transcriptional regulator, anaerobic regulatory protein